MSTPHHRQLCLEPDEHGYGFTLRHYLLDDVKQPVLQGYDDGKLVDSVFIQSIRQGGPADQWHLQVGDKILYINGIPVKGLTYTQIVRKIHNDCPFLKLDVVNQCETMTAENAKPRYKCELHMQPDSPGHSHYPDTRQTALDARSHFFDAHKRQFPWKQKEASVTSNELVDVQCGSSVRVTLQKTSPHSILIADKPVPEETVTPPTINIYFGGDVSMRDPPVTICQHQVTPSESVQYFNSSPTRPVSSPVYYVQPTSSRLHNEFPIYNASQQSLVQSAKLRSRAISEDRNSRVKRRTSYLVATNKPKPQMNMETSKSDTHLPLNAPESPSTPGKAANIRKLKAFFGERTPRIIEAANVEYAPHKEGLLLCKMAVNDGKRSSDRSWKQVWAVLDRGCLSLYKDKISPLAAQAPDDTITIVAAIVDIAYDYTKKRNVFRLTTLNGSEYLFQADDHDMMVDWIDALHSHSTVTDHEIMVKKSSIVKMTMNNKSSTSLYAKQKTRDEESPKSSKEASGKTLKGKMGWRFKRTVSSGAGGTIVNGTFQVPLSLCPMSIENPLVPEVVHLCCTQVEKLGISNQGIYRVPGNSGAVNALQEELNNNVYAVDTSSDRWLDVNVVSSLVKAFFRKLPQSLVTDDLYDCIIAANRHADPVKRMLLIKKVIHDLPDCNFETLHYLGNHLNRVINNGHINKMDARNIAIIFGPTIIRAPDSNMMTMVQDMSDQCRIVESIVLHHEWFFSSWLADHDVPVDSNDSEMQVTGMNSELIAKAQTLGEKKEFGAKSMVESIISAANRKKKKKTKDLMMSPDMMHTSAPNRYSIMLPNSNENSQSEQWNSFSDVDKSEWKPLQISELSESDDWHRTQPHPVEGQVQHWDSPQPRCGEEDRQEQWSSISESTQQHLKRLEMEAAAVRLREEQSRHARQRIEEELRKTLQELEDENKAPPDGYLSSHQLSPSEFDSRKAFVNCSPSNEIGYTKVSHRRGSLDSLRDLYIGNVPRQQENKLVKPRPSRRRLEPEVAWYSWSDLRRSGKNPPLVGVASRIQREPSGRAGHNTAVSMGLSPKKNRKKGVERRHTVGGTKDSDHFNALMALKQSHSSGSRLSAVQRLKPNLTDNSIQDWIHEQRLRPISRHENTPPKPKGATNRAVAFESAI